MFIKPYSQVITVLQKNAAVYFLTIFFFTEFNDYYGLYWHRIFQDFVGHSVASSDSKAGPDVKMGFFFTEYEIVASLLC